MDSRDVYVALRSRQRAIFQEANMAAEMAGELDDNEVQVHQDVLNYEQ